MHKNKKGFTVAEVIVAAAIFMAFSGALFSLYRMGSRMFVSGSWKFTRQKEAERFFEILKERVEQASNMVKIDPSSTPQIETNASRFMTKKGVVIDLAENAKASGSNIQLAEFAVCKPCQFLSSSNRKTGIIVLHSLTVVPDSDSGLYKLNLFVKRIDDNNLTDCFSMGAADGLNMAQANFLGDPVNFGLQPVPGIFTLRDVCSVTLNYSEGAEESGASGNLQAIKPILYEVRVKMRNPKHAQTVLEMGYKFKIDGSVKVEEVGAR